MDVPEMYTDRWTDDGRDRGNTICPHQGNKIQQIPGYTIAPGTQSHYTHFIQDTIH